ncbi:hypothetical protein FHR71_003945 [Methylobacterium sp. RAS18]|nr:hypothetical protein [Methylobacterium sp. RAS18]
MVLGIVPQQIHEMPRQGYLSDARLRLGPLYLAERGDALIYRQHACIEVEAVGAQGRDLPEPQAAERREVDEASEHRVGLHPKAVRTGIDRLQQFTDLGRREHPHRLALHRLHLRDVGAEDGLHRVATTEAEVFDLSIVFEVLPPRHWTELGSFHGIMHPIDVRPFQIGEDQPSYGRHQVFINRDFDGSDMHATANPFSRAILQRLEIVGRGLGDRDPCVGTYSGAVVELALNSAAEGIGVLLPCELAAAVCAALLVADDVSLSYLSARSLPFALLHTRHGQTLLLGVVGTAV